MSKFITREITITNAEVLLFDKEDKTLKTTTITCPGKLTEKAIIIYTEKNTNMKVVEVTKTEYLNKLYGVTLETFLANAIELDSETRKPL